MKRFVKISSTLNINVTAGLQYKDVTNPDARVAEQLKVGALWPKTTVLILQGVHWYPSEILEWNTVKNLVKDNVLTIGEYSDEANEERAIIIREKLLLSLAQVNKEMTVKNEEKKISSKKTKSLDALSEE